MADQKLPHFIPRIQTGNRSPRNNNLQGWFCPFKCSLFPSACGTPRDAGHSQLYQHQRGCRTHPVLAVPPGWRSTASRGHPCSWQSFSSQPSEMAGRKQSSDCVPENSPWAAAVHNSSSCFPFFSFHERTRNYGDNFVQFPLRCKSGLKVAKRRF